MAERALATAFVNIVPGTKDFDTLLKGQLTGKMDGLGQESGGKFSSGFGGALSKIGGVLSVAFGAGVVANFTKSLIDAGEAEVAGNARLENITKSMGLFGDKAGAVATRLEDLSGVQQLALGIDDDVIKSTQAKLLTFKDLASSADSAGGAFDRATMAALDLAAAGFGTAESNAVQLGKALQDPIKGLTALARSGVTFTDAEKARIKTLVESNQVGEAQNLILKAIETQVGGTAAATTTASARMEQGFANLKETLGLLLLPVFNAFALFVTDTALPAINNFVDAFKRGETPINGVFNAISATLNFVKDNWTWISTLTTAVLAGVAAFQAYEGIINAVKFAKIAWTTITGIATIAMGLFRGATLTSTLAQLGFNTALLANPIGLVIAAVAALVVGLTYFFTQTKVGQDVWKNFTSFLGTAFKSAGSAIKIVWDGILSAGKAVFNGLSTAVEIWANTWIGALNLIFKPLNDLLGLVRTLSGGRIDLKIPSVAPITLPKLAKGGFVDQATTAIIGEAGPEVVTPLKDFERMMGIGQNNNAPAITYIAAPNNSLDAEQALFQAIKRAKVVGAW